MFKFKLLRFLVYYGPSIQSAFRMLQPWAFGSLKMRRGLGLGLYYLNSPKVTFYMNYLFYDCYSIIWHIYIYINYYYSDLLPCSTRFSLAKHAYANGYIDQ